MEKIECELYVDVSNCPVMRHPGRKFPGVLIQGDTLNGLKGLADEIISQFKKNDLQEAKETAEELKEQLEGYQKVYEFALEKAGMGLPYAKRTDR